LRREIEIINAVKISYMITREKENVNTTIKAKSRAEVIDKFTKLINGLSCEHYFHLHIMGVISGEETSDGKVQDTHSHVVQ
jgi:hypothetical protein